MQCVLEGLEIQKLSRRLGIEYNGVLGIQLPQLIQALLLPCSDVTPVAIEQIFSRIISHELKTIPETGSALQTGSNIQDPRNVPFPSTLLPGFTNTRREIPGFRTEFSIVSPRKP